MDGYRNDKAASGKALKLLDFVNTKVFPLLVVIYIIGMCLRVWLKDNRPISAIAGLLLFLAIGALLRHAERRAADFKR
jgi:hypothetical protein